MAVSRLLVLLVVAVAATVVPGCQGTLRSAVYVVSNTKAVGQGTSGQVQYQTRPTSAIIEALVSQKEQDVTADHKTVVFLGCQGKGPVFTEQGALADLVSKAVSSAVYVNAEQAASPEVLRSDLAKALGSSGLEFEMIGCGGGDHKVADATQPILLVCSSCADELEQVQQLQAELDPHQYTLVYAPAADPAAATLAATRKRRLHASAAPADFTCDATCKTQVKWLQGVLAAMLMVLALFSGLGCLYFLETPTKFETPKEQ